MCLALGNTVVLKIKVSKNYSFFNVLETSTLTTFFLQNWEKIMQNVPKMYVANNYARISKIFCFTMLLVCSSPYHLTRINWVQPNIRRWVKPSQVIMHIWFLLVLILGQELNVYRWRKKIINSYKLLFICSYNFRWYWNFSNQTATPSLSEIFLECSPY